VTKLKELRALLANYESSVDWEKEIAYEDLTCALVDAAPDLLRAVEATIEELAAWERATMTYSDEDLDAHAAAKRELSEALEPFRR